ncbi:MAG: tetratricopeptide repeat protein, partial [Elusimicrobiota bacterium]
LGRVEEAERAFGGALSAEPASTLPRVELSGFLQAAGRTDEAQEIMADAAGASPGAASWETFLWRGRIEEKKGRLPQAERAYRKAVSADPKSAALEIELARFLIDRGRLEEAAPRLVRALELGEASGTVQLTLGRVYGKLKNFKKAEQTFLSALSADPASAPLELEFAQLLEEQGRFDEAVTHGLRALELGGPSCPAHLILGRAYAKLGRVEEAERAFGGALSADPASAPLELEFAQVLEEQGRFEEAMTHSLRALELGGPPGIFALMECAAHRKVFLAELSHKSARLDRAEAALRCVLGSDRRLAGARTLLADVLLARKRLKAAETELKAAFLPEGRTAETSRIDVLLKLIERGRYGPGLERSVLDCLARAETSEKIVLDWPQIFSALMCARRYQEAFRLGETMLDRSRGFQAPGHLMWPWWRINRRAVSEERFIALELGRIRAAAKSGKFPHWYAYYRAILLSYQSRNEDAMVEYSKLKPLDFERYSWMRQSFVLVKLGVLDFDGAIEISRDILSRAPSHWWVRCRMAEASIARGDTARGLGGFRQALRTCDPASKGEVLTWHGEVLLWLGEYARALEKLDEAVALGAKTFVFGWRGAARLKLGDRAGALADLDHAVALDPKDFEARVWRAETYRCLGRNADALQDAEYVIIHDPKNFWAYLNRALLRDAGDDESGMAADLAEAPTE